MSDQETRLRAALRDAQQTVAANAPKFDSVWRAALIRAKRRRGNKRFAGIAAAAAAALLALNTLTPDDDETHYVNMDELMGSTSWSAPSDFLLPKHEIDIYRDLPQLFESTESDGGTLL